MYVLYNNTSFTVQYWDAEDVDLVLRYLYSWVDSVQLTRWVGVQPEEHGAVRVLAT